VLGGGCDADQSVGPYGSWKLGHRETPDGRADDDVQGFHGEGPPAERHALARIDHGLLRRRDDGRRRPRSGRLGDAANEDPSRSDHGEEGRPLVVCGGAPLLLRPAAAGAGEDELTFALEFTTVAPQGLDSLGRRTGLAGLELMEPSDPARPERDYKPLGSSVI